MITIPAPAHAREEWPDADFDFPEGHALRAPPDALFDKDDEDWDMEMDIGETGGARAYLAGSFTRASNAPAKGMVTIRPPLPETITHSLSIDGDDDDEGISTIKVSALPAFPSKTISPLVIVDDDMEADFALPNDLTQLSLRPLSLHHRSSKGSMEWGDRDHTQSSASSSEAYSSLGFDAAPSPSTISSMPTTDDDRDDEDDGELEGLVLPSGLFESSQGRKKLTKILDSKKNLPKVAEDVKIAKTNPEDDFEIGLVINGDDDLSPSKLVYNQQTKRMGTLNARSNSLPARPSQLRPPSRLKGERPRTPMGSAGSSGQGSSKLSTSPPSRPSQGKRAQTFLTLAPPSQPPSSFLAPKSGALRNQKSHSGLKSPSPPNSAHRKLSRKASLSSLMETSNAQASSSNASRPPLPSGYSATTAASRARTHTNSTGRMGSLDPHVPPTRPSTPSSNPAALRLTMPTSMARMKSRPAISSVFPTAPSPVPSPPPSQTGRLNRSPPAPSTSSRPPSSLGSAKVLRRTKRRVFGDGTELDGIEDLPVDREKEARLRVQPKGYQSRVPSASFPKDKDKDLGKGTIRRKRDMDSAMQPSAAANTLKQKHSRMDNLSKTDGSKKRPSPTHSGHTRRKPTLIRNLGGSNQPRVVGEMKWNPQTLRWEGNDQVLREFDSAVGTSVRPALITHLTGSSIGSPAAGSFGNAARVVGNMVFDPSRMCWMSTLPPEDDEPDVFADMADDEEEDGWDSKAATIRASQQISRTNTSAQSDASSQRSSRMETPSPIQSLHHHSRSESDSDHGSRASIVFDVDEGFLEACRAAESRHRLEMKGWTINRSSHPRQSISEVDRSHLYDIRTLATKQY
ncbi:hypothetical protein SCHPADRAFT_827212 [Schizopora paradoxa]|uniref:Protein byr4 n=1 Tax=Schizopora paradoxa TaxID=27342 RepID=A0A0H2SAP2_9AGAM|nr:hypothetical protein SCHPADRAFT_827212 [Schizopora paradoxa]